MTSIARTLRVFAIYLGLLAIVLLVAPNLLLRAFGLPSTADVWIRVVGMLVAFLGVYYWVGAAGGFVPFFQATVLCRLTVPVFFLIFVLAAWVQWPLLLFAVVDVLGAGWTWWELRRAPAAA